MKVHFKTRNDARRFAQQGKSKGFPRKVVDVGDHPVSKRWGVDCSKV